MLQSPWNPEAFRTPHCPKAAAITHIAQGYNAHIRKVTTGQKTGQNPFGISTPEFPHRAEEARALQYPQCHVEDPGYGFAHPVSPEDILERLSQLPRSIRKELAQRFDHLCLPRLRKKSLKPCYGMQWKSTVYLFPIERSGIEKYNANVLPAFKNSLTRCGAKWIWNEEEHLWECHWTQESIRIFCLEDVILHEIGHLLDDRNHSTKDREAYAIAFAQQYGNPPKRYKGKKPPHNERKNKRHG